MCSGCGHFSKKHVLTDTHKQSRVSSKFQCEVLMIHAREAIAAALTKRLQPGRIYAPINFACPTMMNHLTSLENGKSCVELCCVELCRPSVVRF